jgi:hypothetical protein
MPRYTVEDLFIDVRLFGICVGGLLLLNVLCAQTAYIAFSAVVAGSYIRRLIRDHSGNNPTH